MCPTDLLFKFCTLEFVSFKEEALIASEVDSPYSHGRRLRNNETNETN